MIILIKNVFKINLTFASSGNFIANLKQSLGNNVIRMNYLGDWGMQFGECVVPHMLLEVKLLLDKPLM